MSTTEILKELRLPLLVIAGPIAFFARTGAVGLEWLAKGLEKYLNFRLPILSYYEQIHYCQYCGKRLR